MDGASGIGRAVVQDKQRQAFPSGEDAVVEAGFLPGGELLGLVLRETGLHGEIGLGKVERLLEFQRFGHGCGERKSLLRRRMRSDS